MAKSGQRPIFPKRRSVLSRLKNDSVSIQPSTKICIRTLAAATTWVRLSLSRSFLHSSKRISRPCKTGYLVFCLISARKRCRSGQLAKVTSEYIWLKIQDADLANGKGSHIPVAQHTNLTFLLKSEERKSQERYLERVCVLFHLLLKREKLRYQNQSNSRFQRSRL